MTQKNSPVLILIILHLVGAIGLWIPSFKNVILPLTPITLLISGLLVFIDLRENIFRNILLFILLFTMGFGVEWIGVNTGFPFGAYSYGTILGPKYGGVSLIIGVNWFFLIVGAFAILEILGLKRKAIVFVGPLLMVALDLLIEPVAIALGFWQWEAGLVPIQNYVSWYLVSIPMFIVFRYVHRPRAPKLAAALFIIQFVFFASLLWIGIKA